MSLWPGYYRGTQLPEPVLTEIPRIKISPELAPEIKIETASGNYYVSSKHRFITANGIASIEDFGAGETFNWMYPHDEIHWILKGKAEMTYSLAGTSHTEQKTVSLKEGDIFLIPLGARIVLKVDPGGPLRNVAMALPAPAASKVMWKDKKKA